MCIFCENSVKFGPVTPELTELICERQVRHGQKVVHLVEYFRINDKNCRLSIVLTAMDQKLQKS